MSADQVKRAFDRYYTSGQKSSSGLGLAIAAAIIHEHRGTISIDSQPGNGTTMHISLPVERASPVEYNTKN